MKASARDTWRPRFFEGDSVFDAVAPAAVRFSEHERFPTPAELTAAFRDVTGVEFVDDRPRRQKRGVATIADYARTIATTRAVPTRRDSWHDFFNALVWATLPKSKLALVERQLSASEGRVDRGRRTREEDALAIIDEGGVIEANTIQSLTRCVVVGHAIYEGRVLGRADPRARGLVIRVPTLELGAIDDELARVLRTTTIESPRTLATTRLEPRDASPTRGAK